MADHRGGISHRIGVSLAILLVGCVAASPPVLETSPPASPRVSSPNAPVILLDQIGSEVDLEPTEQEIDSARASLEGSKGFIAFIPPIINTGYHFTVARAARQQAENLDLPLEVQSAGADPEIAVGLIQDAVARGVKVIIIDIFDPSIRAALEEAIQQGVLLIQYAGRTGTDLGAVTISVEDDELGRVAGQYAAALIRDEMGGRANVVILDFPDSPQVVERADAIRTALTEMLPNVVIVGSYVGGITDLAAQSMTQALIDHPDINVVVSINDAGAYGAYQVLEVAGRSANGTIIVGIDGEEQAREYIAADTMYRGTVDTQPDQTGVMVVNAAIKLLAGGTMPQNIRVPVELITRDNLP